MFGRENHYTKKGLFKLIVYLIGDVTIGRQMRFYYIKKILKDKIKNKEKILDAGCGEGQYSFYIKRKYNQTTIKGIDYNKNSILSCNIIKEKKN